MNDFKMDLERLYQKLSDRRLKLPTSSSLAPQTIKKYERDAKRLRDRLDQMPWDQPLSHRLKAAFTENVSRPSYARELRAALRASTIAELDGNLLKTRAALDVNDLCSANFAVHDAERNWLWAQTIMEVAADGDWGLKNPARRKSKVSVLRKLPTGWREMLVEHLKAANNRFWPAAGVLACVGCRPEELRLDVKVKPMDSGAVSFSVTSAKAGSRRPRNFIILEGDRMFDLAMSLTSVGETIGLGGRDYKLTSQLGDTIRRASKKLFAEIDDNVSPYCFRHRFSSDLKASGFTHTQVAEALGHIDINTQSRYGRTRHGSSGRRIIIHTDIPVHGVLKIPRLATPAALQARPDLCLLPQDNNPTSHSPSPDDDGPRL